MGGGHGGWGDGWVVGMVGGWGGGHGGWVVDGWWQRCQPLRFWRNHYAFLAPTTLLRRSTKSLRFFLLISLKFCRNDHLLACPTAMYLVSLESSLKMWKNGANSMLIL